ncbi:MAG: ABC transporter ATP-binding protein [Mariniblastus sp.]
MNLLNIRNAVAFRGKTKVFDGLDLTIPLGKSTAILGPNGAGKSTLLKIISRDIYPVQTSDAKVEILGQSRWNVWDLRERLGLVSQDLQNNYSPTASGYDVVASGLFSSIGVYQTILEDHKSRIEDAMEELGINHLQHTPFSKMSTGERRRFLLARAMVNQPEAYIFDEPTSGLDLKATFQYLNTVERLIETNHTVVVVTHHLHEIAPSIEHIVLLKSGQVLAEGSKREILTSEKICELFDAKIKVVETDGYFRAIPG